MKRNKIILAALLFATAVSLTPVASAQKQTDLAASFFGSFNQSSSSGVDLQSASNSAGGLLELRYIFNSYAGMEATYSYQQANQMYGYSQPVSLRPIPCPGFNCSYPAPTYANPISVSAREQSITAAWVVSRKLHNFRPFALAGGGWAFFLPDSQSYVTETTGLPYSQLYPVTASSKTQFLIVAGAGLDWEVFHHVGLRLQDREDFYKPPQLLPASLYPLGGGGTPSGYTHSQQPALGIYYRF